MSTKNAIVALTGALVGILIGTYAVIEFKRHLTPQEQPAHTFHAIGQF